MIQEAYVSFETAKLLKEKGFDELCHSHYDMINRHRLNENGFHWENSDYDTIGIKKIACPTQQMAMCWLREVHHVAITLHSTSLVSGAFLYKPFINCYGKYLDYIDNVEYPRYEEACEAAIKYCLEHLIG